MWQMSGQLNKTPVTQAWTPLVAREKCVFPNLMANGRWRLMLGLASSASDRPCQIPDHLAKSLILLVGSFRGACPLECKDSLTTLWALVKRWKLQQKPETEAVCLQSKSCTFWNALVGATRYKFYFKDEHSLFQICLKLLKLLLLLSKYFMSICRQLAPSTQTTGNCGNLH